MKKALCSILLFTAYQMLNFGNLLSDICIPMKTANEEKFRLRYKRERFEIVGQGGFAKVYKVYDSQLQRYVALKYTFPIDDIDMKFAANEYRLLNKMRKIPELNILEENDTCHYENKKLKIKMKLFDTDLANFIKSSEPMAYSIVWRLYAVLNITRAVMKLHSVNILHNDIKLENILIASPIEIFLSDYGLSMEATHHDKNKEYKTATTNAVYGTKGFTDPTISYNLSYSNRSDNYSLGATIFLLFIGQYYKPKGYSTFNDYIDYYLNRHGDLPHIKVYSIFFDKIVRKMLHRDINQRPTDKQIMTDIVKAVKDSLEYLHIGKSPNSYLRLGIKDLMRYPAKELVDLFNKTMNEKLCTKDKRSNCVDKKYYQSLVKNNWVFFDSLPETIQNDFPENLNKIREGKDYKNMVYSDGLLPWPKKKSEGGFFSKLLCGCSGKKKKLII